MSQSVFQRRRLTPEQLRAVARMRLGDAESLVSTGDRARANGAVYMAGFAIECLLKALLLDRHPNLGSPIDPARLSASDRRVFDLLYRLHELDEMLELLPEVAKKLQASEGRMSNAPSWTRFQALCEEWAVYIRYSPKTTSLMEAGEFVKIVKSVRPILELV